MKDMRARTPAVISRGEDSRELVVEWRDGHTSRYYWDDLRRSCPCALCAGEMGTPGSMHAGVILTAAQTYLESIELVGSYAVRMHWEDGHNTGIYTFDGLREGCPCCAESN
jgi:DUF971 family protein